VRVLLLLAVVAGGYFAFAAYGEDLFSHRLSHEEQQVRDEIDRLVQQKAELEALRDYLRTNDYVEGVARRVLGWVRPGETLYVIESDAPATPEVTAANGEPSDQTWWERLYKP
jgi:cell division protein FtsB